MLWHLLNNPGWNTEPSQDVAKVTRYTHASDKGYAMPCCQRFHHCLSKGFDPILYSELTKIGRIPWDDNALIALDGSTMQLDYPGTRPVVNPFHAHRSKRHLESV